MPTRAITTSTCPTRWRRPSLMIGKSSSTSCAPTSLEARSWRPSWFPLRRHERRRKRHDVFALVGHRCNFVAAEFFHFFDTYHGMHRHINTPSAGEFAAQTLRGGIEQYRRGRDAQQAFDFYDALQAGGGVHLFGVQFVEFPLVVENDFVDGFAARHGNCVSAISRLHSVGCRSCVPPAPHSRRRTSCSD